MKFIFGTIFSAAFCAAVSPGGLPPAVVSRDCVVNIAISMLTFVISAWALTVHQLALQLVEVMFTTLIADHPSSRAPVVFARGDSTRLPELIESSPPSVDAANLMTQLLPRCSFS